MAYYEFYKNERTDSIYWVDNPDSKGEHLFSFDKKKIYNLFRDYPHNMTESEVEIFNKENPFWAEYFSEPKK